MAVAALAALAAQWPAAHALKRLSAGSGVAFGGIEGTVWKGTAARTRYHDLALGRLRWNLSPASLLRLSPSAEVQIEGSELAARFTVERPRGGGLEFHDLSARLPAGWLQRVLNEPYLSLAGQIRFELDRVGIGADGRLRALDGRASWDEARASIVTSLRPGSGSSRPVDADLSAELGSLAVDWRTESTGVMLGSLTDSGGPLQLNGEVTVTADHYRIDARLAARGEAPALRQALELLGRADAAGWVRLRIGGPMLALGGGAR